MRLQREHALVLRQLRADRQAGRAFTEWASAFGEEPWISEALRELELQGLARLPTPARAVPTYAGEALSSLLDELVETGALPPPERWHPGWRWLGSEVITLLEAAERAGRVGPLGVDPLLERGLAVHERDEVGRERVVLNEAGQRILELYREHRPQLEISWDLAALIRRLPQGPAPVSHLPQDTHAERTLEAMQLIAFGVPTPQIYAFTALGQAVKRALTLGIGLGSDETTVGAPLTGDLLVALAELVDGGEGDNARDRGGTARATLEALGYLTPAGDPTPAGEWALEALRLWRDRPARDVWSFALEAEEAEVLKTLDRLVRRHDRGQGDPPTFVVLRRELIDRKIREYKALLERYGRRLHELPERKRLVLQRFQEARDLARWYDDNFELRETLYSLEALRLIETRSDDQGREVFRLTAQGERVCADQARQERDISATAVKAITLTRQTFAAPSLAWWEEGRDQGLLGTSEPTASGWLYAELAETLERLPHLTRHELKVLQRIPSRGITVDDILQALEEEMPPERIRWALEKLEARHLIDVLPDGNVVETEAGELLDRALAGVPPGFGNPVNPLIYRVVRALREVGTLYVKERRVRVLPRNVAEAQRRSGLPPDAFRSALDMARVAGFVGRNSVTEAGLLLLDAVERLRPRSEEREAVVNPHESIDLQT